MRCSQCGAEIIEDAKFCGNCGAAINNENEKIPKTESAKKLQGQPANEIVTAPTPETKDDGGIVKPMKIMLGMVGGFALFCAFLVGLPKSQPKQQPKQQVTQQQTQQQQQQQKQQQPTQQQAQQQSKRVTTEEKFGLKFYDFKVDTMPEVDIKKEGSALVGVSCMIENVSQDTVTLYTIEFFLRKQGQNTFKTIWTNSGFTKSLTADNARRRTVGVSYDSKIDLFPGDKTYAVFVFDTNIRGGDITDWVLCMKYNEDFKEKLFPIVKF